MTRPLVSVCCLAYKHEKYISQAIDSFVMQQTNFQFEIVIGEDCSPDRTRKIIQQYADRYPHLIKPIFHQENVGAINNFLSVISQCKGTFVAICEGDDYWTDPCKLQVQVDAMLSAGRECSLSFHAATIVDATDESEKRVKRSARHDRIFQVDEMITGGGSLICTPSMMFRRDVLNNLPEYFKQYSASDYALSLVAASSGITIYLNRVFCAYRVNVSSSATTVMSGMDLSEALKYRINSIQMLNAFNALTFGEYSGAVKRKISQYLRVTICNSIASPSVKYSELKKHHSMLTRTDRLISYCTVLLPKGRILHKIISKLISHFYCLKHGIWIN